MEKGMKLLTGGQPGLLDPSQPSRILKDPRSHFIFYTSPKDRFKKSKIGSSINCGSSDTKIEQRIAREIGPGGTCLQTLSVPQPILEDGFIPSGITWPKLVSVGTDWVYFSREQWDIYNIDPAYSCFIGPCHWRVERIKENTGVDIVEEARTANTVDSETTTDLVNVNSEALLRDSEEKLARTESQLQILTEKIARAESRLTEAEEGADEAETRRRNASISLTSITEMTEATQHRLSRLEASVTDAEEKLIDTDAKLADLGAQVEDAQRRLNQAEGRENEAEGRLREATASLDAVTAQEQDLQRRLADLEAKVASSETKLSDTSTKLADTSAKLADTSARLTDTSAKLVDIGAQVEDAQRRLNQAEEGGNEAEERLREATASLDAAKAQERDLQRHLADLEAREASSERKFSDTSAKLVDTSAKLADTSARLTDTSAKLADMGAQVEDAQRRLDQAEGGANEAEERLRETAASLDAAKAQERDLQHCLANLEAKVASFETRLGDTNVTLVDTSAKLADASARLTDTSAKLANMGAQVEDAQRHLDQAEGGANEAEERLREATASLDAIKAQERDLQRCLADLEAKVASSETRLVHLDAQVEEAQRCLHHAEKDTNWNEAETRLRNAAASLDAIIAQEGDARRRPTDLETKVMGSEARLSGTSAKLVGIDERVGDARCRLDRAEEGVNEAEERPRRAATTLSVIMAEIGDARSHLVDLNAKFDEAERRSCVDKQVGSEGTAAKIPKTNVSPAETKFTNEVMKTTQPGKKHNGISTNLDHLAHNGGAQTDDAGTLLAAETDFDEPHMRCGARVVDEETKVNGVEAVLSQSSPTTRRTVTEAEPKGRPARVEDRSNPDTKARETQQAAEEKSGYVGSGDTNAKFSGADARVDEDANTVPNEISANLGSVTTETMGAQDRPAHAEDQSHRTETQFTAKTRSDRTKPNDCSISELACTDARGPADDTDAIQSKIVTNSASVVTDAAAGAAKDRPAREEHRANDTDTKQSPAAETRSVDRKSMASKTSTEVQDRSSEARTELVSVQAELARANADLDVIREEIAEAQKRKGVLERDAMRANAIIADAKEHIARKDKSKAEATEEWRKVAGARARAREDLEKIKAVDAQTKDQLAETRARAEQTERELATSREAVTQTARKKEGLEGDIVKLERVIAELEVKIQEGRDQHVDVAEKVKQALEGLADAKKRKDELERAALEIAAKADKDKRQKQDELDLQDKLYHAAAEEMKTKMEAYRQQVLYELAGALQRKEELDRVTAEAMAKFARDEQQFHEADGRFEASIRERTQYLAGLEERVGCEEEMVSGLNRTKEQLSSTIAELATKIATGTQEVKNTEEAVAGAHRKKNELDYSAEKMEIELEESMRRLADLEEATVRARQKKEQLDQDVAESETRAEERAVYLANLEEEIRRVEVTGVDAQRRKDELERRIDTFEGLLWAYNIPTLDRPADPEQMLGARLWSERDELTGEEMDVDKEPRILVTNPRLKRVCTKATNGNELVVDVDDRALGAENTQGDEEHADAGADDIAGAVDIGSAGPYVEHMADSEHADTSGSSASRACLDEQGTQRSSHPSHASVLKRNTSQKLKLGTIREAQAWFREREDLHRRNRLAWRSVSSSGSKLEDQAFQTWDELWTQWNSFKGYYLSRGAVVEVGTKRTLEFRDVPWPTMQPLGARSFKDTWKSLNTSNEDARSRDEQDVETCFGIIARNAFQGDRKKAAIRLLQVFHPDKWNTAKYAWFGKDRVKDVEMAVRMVSTTLGRIKNVEGSG
ncbi:hypothetical protein K488DRAFT_86698 [Vararia minispora EC-137]|uniref:Uncharacterized protein n=1 Tax=Vararia minispora EC-137 TaxID=1314806 RepID=A0ACB8QJ17_9AGAM|nr:hypothetical protein K488DRAFT_86698 [Vararia minispora EC-137]